MYFLRFIGNESKVAKCIQNFKLNKRCHFFMYVLQMGKNTILLCVRLQGQKEFVYSNSAVFTLYTHTHARASI